MIKKNLKYIIAFIIVGLVLGYNFYGSETKVPDEPTIVGYVTEVEEERFLVAEAEPGVYFDSLDELEGRKIYFSIVEDTEILFENEVVDFEDVSVGDLVHAWHQGPIMESHPEQTEAKKILMLEENFRSYESEIKGISIDVPVGGSVNYEEGRLKVTFVGPDSQMTEITDGFTLFVDVYQSEDELRSEAEREFEEATEVLDPINPPEQIGTDYRFSVESGLGNETVYNVFNLVGRTIVTAETISDPNEVGYGQVVADIISSIEVKGTDISVNENNCVVSGCSGEICSLDGPVETTCEALPGAECLSYASCDFVEDECGWILSEEAARCFMEVEEEFGDRSRDSRIGHLFDEAEKVLN